MHRIIAAMIFAACLAACKGGGTAKTAEQAATSGYRRVIELSDSLLRAGGADTIALGRMSEGEVRTYSVGLKNMEPSPVVVTGVETTCGCTRVDYPKRPIKPGGTATLTFTFDSKGERGLQFKAFHLSTSINAHRYRIYLSGEVVPAT